MAVRLVGRAATTTPMASHGVAVERRSGNTWQRIADGEAVGQNELIRFNVNGALPLTLLKIRVFAPTSGEVFRVEERTNIGGNAFVTFTAPFELGRYSVVVEAFNRPFLSASHGASTMFTVLEKPPTPPRPEEKEKSAISKILSFLDPDKILPILLVVGAIVLVPRVLDILPKGRRGSNGDK